MSSSTGVIAIIYLDKFRTLGEVKRMLDDSAVISMDVHRGDGEYRVEVPRLQRHMIVFMQTNGSAKVVRSNLNGLYWVIGTITLEVGPEICGATPPSINQLRVHKTYM